MTAELVRAQRMLADLRRVGAMGPLRDLLHGHELNAAKAWSDLEERVRKYLESEKLPYEALMDLYERVRFHTFKSHFFYKVSKEARAQCLKQFKPPSSPFSAEFPAPLPTDALRKKGVSATLPTLVRYEKNDDGGVEFVFCNAREQTEREELPEDAVTPEVRELYPDAKFFAEKLQYYQSFDIVRVSPLDKVIHISVDAQGRSTGAHEANLRLAFQKLTGLSSAEFSKPVDLFKAVESIYDDSTEGRVCDIHFDCPTQAVRHESLRRSKKDLRKEIFHMAGKKAVTDISPYRIAVIWKRKNVEVEGLLPGAHRMLISESGLYHCIVPGFADPDDIEFVLKRVRHHASA